jgi:hypothetical protein
MWNSFWIYDFTTRAPNDPSREDIYLGAFPTNLYLIHVFVLHATSSIYLDPPLLAVSVFHHPLPIFFFGLPL